MNPLFASADPQDTLDSVLHALGDAVCVTDENMVFVAANLNFAKFYGMNTPAQLIGKQALEVYPAFKSSVFYEGCERTARTGEIVTRFGYSNNLKAWLVMRSYPLGDKRFAMVVHGVSKDAHKTGYGSGHDGLTSLPNRWSFEQDAYSFEGYKQHAQLWLFDISHFKGLNERLGFHAGDRCLVEVAARLKALVSSFGRVYRVGDDRFLVVCTVPRGTEGAPTPEQALAGLQEPVSVGEATYVLQFHAGTSDSASADSLLGALSHAERAVDYGKQHKRRITAYRPELDDASYNPALTQAIREGLGQNQFVLFFQPQVDLIDRRVVGVEALVRWRHPTRGLVPPIDFLPFAEETGLIGEIDREVVRMAFDTANEWAKKGIPLHLSVNLSAQSLCQDDTVEWFQEHLARTKLDPGMITVEITETALMHDPSMGQRVVAQLRRMGFNLAIDDFGSGYSSMAYLVRYPAHFLKIDRSFIHPMVTEASHETMVRNVIGLAHGLSIAVVAEGVETEEHMTLLAKLGCEVAQGYHIAKPMDEPSLMKWLENRKMGKLGSDIQ